MASDNPSGADNQQETAGSMDQLDPMWIAGLVDGEGCFSFSAPVHRNLFMHRHRGWQLQTAFQVYQHRDRLKVLDDLRTCFGCGGIASKGPKSSVMTYSVTARRHLEEVILPFFEDHPIQVKTADFTAFAWIVRAMGRREHLTEAGFERIVRLSYTMNLHGKQRARSIDEVLAGSSETARQAVS